jgi:ribonuclease HII
LFCYSSLLLKKNNLLPAFYQDALLEAGVDEAGRGCYAGPVFAAAVVLPKHFAHPLLNDSKQLNVAQRNELRRVIETGSTAFAVAWASEATIDRINILQATYQAMHSAIAQLAVQPQLLLIDGNRFKPYPQLPHQCFVKGDGRFASIAAASILAKTYRDEWMERLHGEFPHYGWDKNKGYGTAAHRNAISQHGLCRYHRKSFDILPKQLSLQGL